MVILVRNEPIDSIVFQHFYKYKGTLQQPGLTLGLVHYVVHIRGLLGRVHFSPQTRFQDINLRRMITHTLGHQHDQAENKKKMKMLFKTVRN